MLPLSAYRLLRTIPLPALLAVGILHAAAQASSIVPTSSQPDCNGIRDLAFVAHMDDDLLFMNPDIDEAIQAGGCVRTVYLTASERNEGADYMRNRESAVRAAYAFMAGLPDDWIADTVQVGAYRLAGFTLRANPRIQLWHMRLTDPWLGKGWGSLTPLSRAESIPGHTVETLEEQPQSYTRASLVDTLAGIIRDYGPTTVRRMDDTIAIAYTELCWRCPGHDHPDHIASARLTREAMMIAPGAYDGIGYVAYPTQEYASNLSQAQITRKTEVFRRYAWVDYRYCRGPENCHQPVGPSESWVRSTYQLPRNDQNIAARQ